MATYKAHPQYSVQSGSVNIQFDHNGLFKTENAEEIAILDALVPMWITRLNESKTEEPAAPKPPAAAKKAHAPTSGK